MRQAVLVVVAIAALGLVVPTAAGAETWSLEMLVHQQTHNEWDDCGVGTMLHKRYTRTRTREGEEPTERVSETRWTVLEVAEEEVRLHMEHREGDQEAWAGSETTANRRRAREIRVHDAGQESVSVQGVDHACAVKRIVRVDDGEEEHLLTVWVHEGLGVLKVVGLEGAMTLTMQVEDFDAEVAVGEETLKALMLRVSAEAEDRTGTGAVYVNFDVPGSVVRMEVTTVEEGRTTRDVQEVVAFVRK